MTSASSYGLRLTGDSSPYIDPQSAERLRRPATRRNQAFSSSASFFTGKGRVAFPLTAPDEALVRFATKQAQPVVRKREDEGRPFPRPTRADFAARA